MSQTLWQSRLIRLIAAFGMLLAVATQVFLPSAAVAAPLPAKLQTPDASQSNLNKNVPITHKGTVVAPLATSQQLNLTIALKEANSQALTQFLTDLYNPASSNFHKFITPSEYATRFGPSAQTRQQVIDWLGSQGFSVNNSVSTGNLINFHGTVAQAQSAFKVNLSTYKRADGSTFFANDRSANVPDALASSVLDVFGLSNEVQAQPYLINGGQVSTPGSSPRRAGPYNTANTPQELRNAYSIPSSYVGTGRTIAVYELGGGYDPNDIATFASTLGIPLANRVDVSVDGQDVRQRGGSQDEIELDIEIANGIAPNSTIMVYDAPNSVVGELDEIQRIASDNMADTASESYGIDETLLVELGLSSFVEAEGAVFRQMAAQGQSFFTSSGDNGSAGDPIQDPQIPADPAAQPYVTSVGGTRLYTTGNGGSLSYTDETVWNRGNRFTQGGAGGGGISGYWPESSAPWQTGPGINNQYEAALGGRQYPDVSADADPVTGYATYTYAGGDAPHWYSFGGTSASSPLWAGITVDAVAVAGHRLGLINPALYKIYNNAAQYAQDFHDVTKGNNDVYCIPGSGSCDDGGPYYPATAGYDLASGIGTPIVSNLVPDLIGAGVQTYISAPQIVPIGVDVGGTASKAISLTTEGTGPINYTSSVAVTTTNTWLSVTPASGTVSGTTPITLNASAGTLAAGDYQANVTITGTVGAQSNVTKIFVFMHVGTIHVSSSQLNFATTDAGPVVTQTLTITTTSTTPQPYFIQYDEANTNYWLTINGVALDSLSSLPVITVTNSAPVNLVVGVDPLRTASPDGARLAPGQYPGELFFINNNYNNLFTGDAPSFDEVDVRLNAQISGQQLSLSPLNLSFNANAGGTIPAAQSFVVTETAVSTAAANVPFTYTLAGTNPSLFTVTPSATTIPASGNVTFTVQPSTTTIAPGYYSAAVLITSTLNPSVAIQEGISFYVQPVSSLSLSTNTLVFTTTTANAGTYSKGVTLTAVGGAINYSASPSLGATTPWLSATPSSGTIQAGASAKLSVLVNTTGLGPGTYQGVIRVFDNTNPTIEAGGSYIPIAIELNVVGTGATGTNPGSLIYPLPFLSNGAGGTATFVTLQNTGVDPANVTVNYYNNNGSFITTTTTTLPVNGQSILDNSVIPTTTTVNAVILSTAPLNVLVTEGAGSANGGTSAAAYNVSPSVGSTLYDPVALNGAFGGFTTTVTLYNTGSVTTTGSISYFDQNGNAATGATANFTLAPHQVTTVSQNNPALSANLSYFGVISSTAGSQLAALVTESNTKANFLATFQATPNLAKTLYVPTAFKSAFGSFNTGFTLANPNSTAVTATISYIDDASGNISGTQTLSIPANGEASSYTPAVTGLPSSFVGSAIISANGAIIATVNEQGAAGSGTYLAVGSPTQTVGLPAVANGAFGSFVTGATLLNVTAAPIQVAVTYYNPDGTPQGPTTVYTVAPYSSVLAYQGASSLPNGFFGTVVATSSAPNSLVATVNAAAPGIFYTYTEPTR